MNQQLQAAEEVLLTPPTLTEAAKIAADAEDRLHEANLLEVQALAMVADRVAALRAEAQSMKAQVDQILAENVKIGHLEEGYITIKTRARTTRIVNVERFRWAFPKEFIQIATVPVQKAEALIGKTRLSPYCDLVRGAETYELAFKFREEEA
jgi:hypothetical protein